MNSDWGWGSIAVVFGFILAGIGVSVFLSVLAEVWRESGKRDVLAERERCAKIAESMPYLVEEGRDGWEHAMGWTAAGVEIAKRIRKDRGSDPPQAETKS